MALLVTSATASVMQKSASQMMVKEEANSTSVKPFPEHWAWRNSESPPLPLMCTTTTGKISSALRRSGVYTAGFGITTSIFPEKGDPMVELIAERIGSCEKSDSKLKF
mgnify:CR=1 FL=1